MRRVLGDLARSGLFLALSSASLSAGEPIRLTNDGQTKFATSFCHQGEDIVFVAFEQAELYRLKRLNVKQRTVEPLHPLATASEFEPAFSADGRYYVYLRLAGVLRINVVIRDVAAGTEAEVIPSPGFAGMRTPTLAPDGSRVAYSFAEKGRQQLYSVNSRGGDCQPLTDSAGINIAPCYSPDGAHIVFSSTRDGNYEIYSMDADGENVVRLTDNSYQDLRPTYSPDGRRIAFTSHRDGNAEIYVMQADGTAPRRITNHPERDDFAAWHPDGRRLAIVSERDGDHDLYLVDVE